MKYLSLMLLGVLLWPAVVSADGYYGGHGSYCGGYSYNYSPGYSYWPGGYWSGGGGYNSGHYAAGYYKNYNYGYDYGKVYYDYPVIKPVFIRYLAVLPLAELPSYGVYHVPTPTAASAGVSPAMPAPAPTVSTTALEGKMDRVLTLLEKQDGRLTRLEAAVFGGGGVAPVPDKPRTAAAPDTDVSDVPTLFHTHCAACHGDKTATKLGKKFVMFVAGPGGVEMAKLDTAGKPAKLEKAELEKIKRKLVSKEMPPETAADGTKLPALPEEDRKKMLAFLEAVTK